MIGILAFGTLWFWVALSISFCIMLWAVEVGSSAGATITLLLSAVAFGVLGNVNVFTYAKDNPLNAVFFIMLYILLGIVWAFIKLYFVTRKIRMEYLAEKEAYLQKEGATIDKWVYDYSNKFLYKTDYSDYVPKIMHWSMFWVWSMVWTIINDPIREAFEYIYTVFSNGYKILFRRMMKPLIEDETSYKIMRDRR